MVKTIFKNFFSHVILCSHLQSSSSLQMMSLSIQSLELKGLEASLFYFSLFLLTSNLSINSVGSISNLLYLPFYLPSLWLKTPLSLAWTTEVTSCFFSVPTLDLLQFILPRVTKVLFFPCKLDHAYLCVKGGNSLLQLYRCGPYLLLYPYFMCPFFSFTVKSSWPLSTSSALDFSTHCMASNIPSWGLSLNVTFSESLPWAIHQKSVLISSPLHWSSFSVIICSLNNTQLYLKLFFLNGMFFNLSILSE